MLAHNLRSKASCFAIVRKGTILLHRDVILSRDLHKKVTPMTCLSDKNKVEGTKLLIRIPTFWGPGPWTLH